MPERQACLNCDEPFGDATPNYCPACGQETRTKPPTLHEFAQQFAGSYIAAEGALWRSLKLLLFKPGQLTREYLEGRRRRYVLPLRLYLTISLLALLALRMGAHVEFRKGGAGGPPLTAQQLVEEMHDFTVIDLGPSRAGLRDGRFFCERLPQWFCERVRVRVDLTPQDLAAEMRALPDRFLQHVGSVMFVLVPAFALAMKFAYRNRRMYYTEHLVYALHLHAFWFFMLAVTALPGKLASDAASLIIPVYTFLAERRVYGGRWWATLLREVAVALGYFVVLAVALVLLGVLVFLG
jgi:hypothetical protein